MQKIQILLFIFLLITFSSCSEEAFTKKNIGESFTANDIKSFSVSTCANMHFEKPPVDILFLVDNTGSTNMESFQALKSEISKTINQVSNEFDYHIYVVPLISDGTDIKSYPLIVSNPDSLTTPVTVNLTSPENLSIFGPPTGNNVEAGFQRAIDVVNSNISNGIFRKNTNLVIVTISNGDENTIYQTIGGNKIPQPSVFEERKNKFIKLTNRDPSSVLEAESLRYLTLVAHSNCKGFATGTQYRNMSSALYSEMGYNDDPSYKYSYNLCNSNYAGLFQSVNKSIRAVLVGHSYDHWKISSAQESEIQQDDIEVIKILQDGSKLNIPQDNTNGFEYLGFQTAINTRYAPSPGEPVTGLVVRLNGNARVSYPECIIAKTRTPTEYFGYVALPREPELGSIKVKIRGENIPQNATNGWTYIGYLETQNIKVPGPTGASTTPAINRTGYFIRLHGDAIFTNGDTVEVNYKPEAI